MASATISVLGLYNYDNTIFNTMVFPMDDTEEQQNIVNNILLDCAELEVIYTDPDFLKWAIGTWSVHELPIWTRIYNASQAEYNPIENYDRIEESTDTVTGTHAHTGTDTTTNTGTDTTSNTGTDTTTNSGKDTTTNSGTDTTTNSGKDSTQFSGSDSSAGTGTHSTTNSGTDTTTNKVAAFNASALVDHDSSATAHGHSVSETTGDNVTVTHGKKEELTHGHVEALQHGHTQELTHGHVEALQHGHTQALQHGHVQALQHGEQIADDVETVRESRIHGNIGVTTSQQMLEQEIELAPKINVCDYITNSFKRRFCILVY